MTGVFSAITNTSRAIAVNQRAIDVISHNVSNVNTPGYHRQTLILKTGTPGGVSDATFTGASGQYGTGVMEDRIERYSWDFLDKRYRLEQSESSKWDTKVEVLKEVESSLSELTDGGLVKKLDNFWDSWQALSADPTSNALRAAVREQGRQLSESFNQRMQGLDSTKANQNLLVKDRVMEINAIGDKIAALNQQIGHTIAAQQQPNDLLDLRDSLLDRLAEIAGAVSYRNTYVVDQKSGQSFDTGQVNVSIGGHVLVIDGSSASKLVYNDTLKTYNWDDGQPYNGYNGELAGLQQASDEIDNQIEGLNNLAHGVIKWVNDIQQTAYQISDAMNVATIDVPININGGQFWVGGNGTAAAAESSDPDNIINAVSASAAFTGIREIGTMTYRVETRNVSGQLQFRVKDADNNGVGIDTNGVNDVGGNTLTTEWRDYTNGTVFDTGRGLTLTFSNPAVSGEVAQIDYTAKGIDLTNATDVGGVANTINATDSLSEVARKINASKLYQTQGRVVDATIVGTTGSYQLMLSPVEAGIAHAVIANSNLTTAGVVPPSGTVPAGAILPFPSGIAVATPARFFEGDDQLGAARNITLSEEVKASLSAITASRSPLTSGDGYIASQMAEGRYALNFELGANGILANANETYNTQATELGLTLNYAINNQKDRNAISNAIKEQRDAFAGVNLDEEAVNMIKFQRAFQAAAKVISVADEMLGRIIDGIKS